MGLQRQVHGPVLVLTLDNPDRRNALDMATLRELGDLFDGLAYRDPLPPEAPPAEADADIGDGGRYRPHAIVLRSTGPVFCAGADLKEMRALGAADFQTNLAAAMDMGAVFRSVRNCPAPVVARVQGPCYGGGVGLAAACDIVVAGHEARFMFSEAKLGLVPGVISPLVADRLGLAAARRYFLTAEPMGAADALRLGLVDRLAEDLDSAVAETVNHILACGPKALGMCKSLLDGVQSLGYARSAEFCARMIAEARTGPEAQRALSAFQARAQAPWTPSAPWTLPACDGNDDA